MADDDSAKNGLDELVKAITGSITAVAQTEQAISEQTQQYLKATTLAVTDLVKANAFSPEIAQENLKLQKAMIDSTIKAINALTPPTMPGDTTKSDDA